MKKFQFTDMRIAKEVVAGIRGDAVEQFFVAQDETNVSKQLKCCDMVAACDLVLHTIKYINEGHPVDRQLNV